MKTISLSRYLTIFVAFTIVLSLTACGISGKINPNSVERISVYTGGVPAQVFRKTVTDVEDIRSIVEHLNRNKVRIHSIERTGGIGTYFELDYKDGRTSIQKWADEDLCAAGWRDIDELWDSIESEEEQVERLPGTMP